MRWGIFWLFGIIALVFCLSLISIHIPLGRDEGVAAYFGWQILEGKVLYRELYHFNFPGIFWTYAIALKLFGLKPEGVNLFDIFFRIFTLLGIYLASSHLFGKRVGLCSAFIYGIFSTVVFNDYWENAQKETFALGGLAYSLYFFSLGVSGERMKKQWLFLAGIFGFWAMLYKPTVGLGPGLAGLYVLLQRGFQKKERWSGILVLGLGFIIPLVIVGVYLESKGAFSEMVRQVFIFGSIYGGQYYSGGLKVIGLLVWRILLWMIDFGFLAGFSILGILGLVKEKARGWKLVFWFGFGLFLNIIIQLKFFTYHFMVLLLPLSIFAGAFFGGQINRWFSSQAAPARIVIWVLALFLFSANLKDDFKRYGREMLYNFGLISKDDFLERYGRWGFGDICVVAQYKVARYLREQTDDEDKVLIFGLEPGINFMARRSAPGKFSYDLPLTYEFYSERSKSYQDELRREFLSELRNEMPVYIVVVENDRSTIEPRDSYEQMLSFVEFRDFIRENYFLETKIEHYYLYKRR